MCEYKLKSETDKNTYFCLYYRGSDLEPCPPRCFHHTEDPPGILETEAERYELRCVYLEVSIEKEKRIFACTVDGSVNPGCRNCPPGHMQIAPTLEEFVGLDE